MELWSLQHIKTLIPSVLFMFLLGAILRLTIGKKSEKIRMIPLKIIGVLLVLLEIGKQALSLQRGYDLYHLPFHYCSIYIFALPVIAFYQGKHKNTVREVGSALTAALFLIMLIYPSLIYSGANIEEFFQDYFSMHTVVFHNLVMLAWVLMVALDIPEFGKAAIKPLVLFLGGFCVISATMAQLLQTNFANFYSCNIPPLENLRISLQGVLGYGFTQFLYVIIVSAVTVGFSLLFYGIGRLPRQLLNKMRSANKVS